MTTSKSCKRYNGPVIVIAGPTASGKTGAGIDLALRLGGRAEVISADSRAIYKYMDIGTAKPSVQEMRGVIHFGLDLVEPGKRFTVADWKRYTLEKISEIRERGNVPLVVGGTGLYIDALVFDYHFGKDGSEQKSCSKKTEVDDEFAAKYPDRVEMSPEYLVYGISWETEELRKRLMQRAEKMFCDALYEETKFLVERYDWNSQAMRSNIYQFVWKYLRSELTKSEAIEQFFYDDWHLAKRQITWFKRNKNIRWCRLDKIIDDILEDLNKKYNF